MKLVFQGFWELTAFGPGGVTLRLQPSPCGGRRKPENYFWLWDEAAEGLDNLAMCSPPPPAARSTI